MTEQKTMREAFAAFSDEFVPLDEKSLQAAAERVADRGPVEIDYDAKLAAMHRMLTRLTIASEMQMKLLAVLLPASVAGLRGELHAEILSKALEIHAEISTLRVRQ